MSTGTPSRLSFLHVALFRHTKILFKARICHCRGFGQKIQTLVVGVLDHPLKCELELCYRGANFTQPHFMKNDVHCGNSTLRVSPVLRRRGFVQKQLLLDEERFPFPTVDKLFQKCQNAVHGKVLYHLPKLSRTAEKHRTYRRPSQLLTACQVLFRERYSLGNSSWVALTSSLLQHGGLCSSSKHIRQDARRPPSQH